MEKHKVYEKIKKMIINHKFYPGQALNEKELMKQFDIGRTPLREILINLQNDGLVIIIPRYGTFVTSLDMDDLLSMIELRIKLEEFVCEILCDRITDMQLLNMHQILVEYENIISNKKPEELSEETLDYLLELESKFHLETYNATNNKFLIEILRKLQVNFMRFWYYFGNDREGLQADFCELKTIYNTIKERDSDACCKLLREHIESFVKYDHIKEINFKELQNNSQIENYINFTEKKWER